MHPVSKSAQRTEPEILELSINVSRRYWGSWFSPLRWRCELSYWSYRRHSHEKARHHARRCEDAAEANQRIRTVFEFTVTLWHSPRIARDRLLVPFAAVKRLRLLQRLLIDRDGRFTGHYEADRWVGPVYRQDLQVPKNAERLVLVLQHAPQGRSREGEGKPPAESRLIPAPSSHFATDLSVSMSLGSVTPFSTLARLPKLLEPHREPVPIRPILGTPREVDHVSIQLLERLQSGPVADGEKPVGNDDPIVRRDADEMRIERRVVQLR